MKKMSFFLVLLFLLPFFKGRAQEVISPAGAHGSSASVLLSWTVGEPVIETFSGSAFVLTQGFHQGRLTITAIDPYTLMGVEIHVYPNPTSAGATVSILNGFSQGHQLMLFDSEGRVLLTKKIRNACETIGLESYPPGVYMIRIQHVSQPGSQTFSIVKH